jgi:hypothetical protein
MDFMTLVRTQWDRVLAVTLTLVGIVVLIVGWYGVSGTAYFAEQLPYVVGNGLGGLFCLGVAAVLWLSADLHDEWRKLDRIEQALLEKADRAVPTMESPVTGQLSGTARAQAGDGYAAPVARRRSVRDRAVQATEG